MFLCCGSPASFVVHSFASHIYTWKFMHEVVTSFSLGHFIHTHTLLFAICFTHYHQQRPTTQANYNSHLNYTIFEQFNQCEPFFFLSFVAFISNGCYASRGKKHFFPLATHSRRIPTKLISVEKKIKKKYFSRFWLPPTAFDGKIGEIFIANEYYPCWIFTVLLFVFFSDSLCMCTK